MEHFIDKYVPIRVSKMVAEFLQACLNENQMTKFESFNMEHTKKLNMHLLEDEND